MAKYAIVMTANWKYIPGVNGMLNALKYYGCDDVELHLVHAFPDNGYIESAQAVFPNLKAVSFVDYRDSVKDKYGDDSPRIDRTIMKVYRWRYVLDHLMDYDAICILDADRQIVNNLRPFFDMTAQGQMLMLAKDDWSTVSWEGYNQTRHLENIPLYSNPFFAPPLRVRELFRMIPEYVKRNQTGDAPATNLALLDSGLIKEVLLLPATQWVMVNMAHVKLAQREVAGKRYIGTHDRGDLLYTFHRRYWGKIYNPNTWGFRHIFPSGTDTERANALNNAILFWEFTRFFNTECYHNIDWVYGDSPYG